jgi:ankyrin repeat protein
MMPAAHLPCLVDCHLHPFASVWLWLAVSFGLALVTRRWIYVPVAAAVAVALQIASQLLLRALSGFDLFEFVDLFPFFVLAKGVALTYALYAAAILFFLAVKRALTWAVIGDASLVTRAAVGAMMFLVLGGAGFATVYLFAPNLLPRRIAERTAELAGHAPVMCGPESARPVDGLPLFRGLPTQAAASFARFERGGLQDVPSIYSSQMGFEHLLTRRRSIRVNNPDAFAPHRHVGLELLIGADGMVKAIAHAGGPSALFERAVEIASRWHFAPFLRDGRPSDVVLRRAAVAIEGPELWQPGAVALPQFSDWDSIEIKVSSGDWERSFDLIIRGDGSVTFDGHGELVALRGRHCAVMPRETLVPLIDAFRRADFFSMRERYLSSGISMAVSIALDDVVKEVSLSGYDEREEAPESVWHVIDAALASVHAERWLTGDAFTAPSLVAEHWDFSRRDLDNTAILSRVARRADIETVRALLALGAPVAAPPRTPRDIVDFGEPAITVLQAAANSGAFDIVRFLLSSDVRWSSAALDDAYVAAIQYGEREAMDMLRARGAGALPKGFRGKTALMAAAEAGDADLVAEILRGSVDVNEVDDVQLTALHWSAVADIPRAAESARADRPRVQELVLRAGANVNARTEMGWTPLIANWIGYESVTAALIRHGSDLNAQDEEGRTALMTNLNPRATEMLLAAGADPYLRNDRGQNALDVARADVFAGEVVRVLERWTAAHPPRRKAGARSP